MRVLLTGGWVYTPAGFRQGDIAVVDNVCSIAADNISDSDIEFERVIDCDSSFILPGLCDVHVHLREPGYGYKETIASGSMAGAHGGYTCLCSMPNLDPAPTEMAGLQSQLDIIKRDAVINVIPYGRITKADAKAGAACADTSDVNAVLADMESMADSVAAFSDDGSGVADADVMEAAMRKAASLGKIIAAHCEDMDYSPEDPRSEWKQLERDLALCEKTGCRYHVCHISSGESVELIRKAKAAGLDVTCETAPHYLVLNNETVRNETAQNEAEGGRFRMNPPIRSEKDRIALIEGLQDGTIDMIATDHAPHTRQEKSGGFAKSLNGITGLETAFPVLYTQLVDKGIISLEKLVELMAINPRRRFGLAEQKDSDMFGTYGLTVVDVSKEYKIDPGEFLSKGRSTPFEGMKVLGRVLLTIADGKIVWEAEA